MVEPLPKDSLLARLRLAESEHRRQRSLESSLLGDAADCIEQLQMPPAKVRELAECDEGADTLALIRALSMQIEGQRKHIAALQKDAARYRWLRHGDNDEAVIRMSGHKRNNYPFLLRNDELDAVIDAKMKEQS
jgi:hypothetical protein